MSKTLKQQAITGTKWSSINQFGKYFISFFLSLILARLLEPEEFGLIGMLGIFTVIASVFINSGLSTAIIRSHDTTEDDYVTVFYFNIFVSLFFYFLLFFLAPTIASFYKEPMLVSLTRWVSLVFLINSFGIVQNAILIKHLDFKTQTISNLAGIIVAAMVGVTMAFMGYGVYSIVGQILSQAFTTNLLLWTMSTWRPKGWFNKQSFRGLWAFSSNILATTIVTQIIDNIDSLVVGKLFAAKQLGFYTRAKNSRDIPLNIFGGILGTISFAVLSKVNHDKTQLRNIHIKLFRLAIWLFAPICVGLIVVAKPFIIVLYTDKWLDSIPILQIVSLYMISHFISVLFSQSIIALGNSKFYLKINSTKRFLNLIAIPFGLFFGFFPYIFAVISLGFVGTFIDLKFGGKHIGVKLILYFKSMLIPITLSLVMGSIVYAISFYHFTDIKLQFFTQVFVGIILYWGFSATFKLREYAFFKEIVINKINKNKL